MKSKQKIIVIGASGVLGGLICEQLNRLFEKEISLFTGDYKADRGTLTAQKYNATFVQTNLVDSQKLSESLETMNAVIVAVHQNEPVIQSVCLERQIPCIDVTAFYPFAKKVENLYKFKNQTTNPTSVVMAGFFPGLSGLLLQKAISKAGTAYEAGITLIQNTNAVAGGSGIFDMLKIISAPVTDCERPTAGFRIKRRILIPEQKIEYSPRLIDHSEKIPLIKRLPVQKLNYWTAWNQTLFNHLISLLNRMKILRIITSKFKSSALNKFIKHNDSKPENTLLIVDIKNKDKQTEHTDYFVIDAYSDYGTTATVIAALCKIILKKPNQGVCYPVDLTTLDQILDIMNEPRVRYTEFLTNVD